MLFFCRVRGVLWGGSVRDGGDGDGFHGVDVDVSGGGGDDDQRSEKMGLIDELSEYDCDETIRKRLCRGVRDTLWMYLFLSLHGYGGFSCLWARELSNTYLAVLNQEKKMFLIMNSKNTMEQVKYNRNQKTFL